MTKEKQIVVGSRGSKLALIQTNWVISELKKLNPGFEFHIEKISTKGDKITDTPLSRLGGVGLFTKELETALIKGKIDLAVHSAKDVPTELHEGLMIGATPKREDPHDVLISNNNANLDKLPDAARIGTSSLRRRAQLLAFRPDFKILDLRGNLDTRLKKLETDDLDAIVVAHAGLRRMGYTGPISQIIPFDIMLPAVGQGSLCIEIRKDDARINKIVSSLDDLQTRIAIEAERALLAKLQGGCQVPIGAYAQIQENKVFLEAIICTMDGDHAIQDRNNGPSHQAAKLGEDLAERMLENGGKRILHEIRQKFQTRIDHM
ncbi:hydroxymethylbilane synthase [Candidatus Brocadia sapporoensis]|uniref:Porphobilinogen deaminase n=1 Tax=Candidatus Brocadia sapporoensis TaxID=392547 RepID=A0A1V6M0W1_9BACT|nr:hydroxymethylbilane synthase [Candidatus Brocadia sapporoensis]MDG6006533.1 hydroxymethylbilane synthase [Candidatus Brocadia sp.]TVL96097.1 MAG: hydroxymethylbilane synthase [Candidatus Brocadia sp. BL1]OQD46020.1 hydroxymethylbilane synthase [Candidatus Brocadia sapporoensis]GJQ24501.1 MAG: porphobilinogen deaminase [Candidatus Brocadia sapporoensis]HQU30898.1 hydroxymethylbilane synthase [Candidatus Brocadia sapporoensis]